jgi:hypothetical protein
MTTLPRPSPEIQQIYFKRFQEELIPQLMSEMRKELLKITPEQLVSYPIWPAIVKYTPFSGGENNPINHLMSISQKTIFLPIIEELQNQGSSSSTTTQGEIKTTQAQTTTTQAETTTTQAETTAPQAETTTTIPPKKISLPPKYAMLSRRTARGRKQMGGQQSTTTVMGPTTSIASIPGKLW